jgi:hypothetical protein
VMSRTLHLEQRKLIVQNILNGAEFEDIGRAFDITEKELLDLFFLFVAKLRSYWMQRRIPYLPCESPSEARRNRIVLLHYLDRINLGVEPAHSKIIIGKFEDVFNVR